MYGVPAAVLMSQVGFVGSLTLTRKLKRRIPGENIVKAGSANHHDNHPS